jgi:energy-coupling factor transporter ATP-binding protein EcfA2
MRPAIEVSNVTKTFRRYRPDRPHTVQEVLAKGLKGIRSTERFWALRNISFTVAAGRAVGIIGTNGSGKSTLLRLVGGVGKVDDGSVTVAGRIAALLDLGSGFHPDLTGRENAIINGVLNGLTRREVLRRLDNIVAFAEEEAASLDLQDTTAVFADLALWWTKWADMRNYCDRLDHLIYTLAVKTVCPTHGLVITDVASTMPKVKEGLLYGSSVAERGTNDASFGKARLSA